MLGDVTFQLLSRVIRNIQTLSQMPVTVLQQNDQEKTVLRFGKRSNGIDNNPVEPYTERKSISSEHATKDDRWLPSNH
jgi:DNA polymerase-4